jgi:hypothetical protein
METKRFNQRQAHHFHINNNSVLHAQVIQQNSPTPSDPYNAFKTHRHTISRLLHCVRKFKRKKGCHNNEKRFIIFLLVDTKRNANLTEIAKAFVTPLL